MPEARCEHGSYEFNTCYLSGEGCSQKYTISRFESNGDSVIGSRSKHDEPAGACFAGEKSITKNIAALLSGAVFQLINLPISREGICEKDFLILTAG